jgi:two-component system cell cycle response regulator DivK
MEMIVGMEISLSRDEQSAARQPVVLVVDDNEDNLMLLAFLVEQLDCTILTAIDGQTALNLAQTYQPSLILLDMMLPDLDGLEVLSRLKQGSSTATIPVIAVTAMARSQDRERILAAGCDEYVTKPYVIEELEALLRRYLRERVED